MTLKDLSDNACPAYYRTYLKGLNPEIDLLTLMENQLENFPKFLKDIPDSKWDYSYAPGKWSLKESLVHVLDTERVFQYRALCLGRKDKTPLPGFDQDSWVPESKSSLKTPKEIIEEYQSIRLSTIYLFKTFSETDLGFVGIASGQEVSLGALGFIICGHQRHHREVARKNYLK